MDLPQFLTRNTIKVAIVDIKATHVLNGRWLFLTLIRLSRFNDIKKRHLKYNA